jgi:tetratricopeptide (TPR) repeat protein
MKQAVNCLLSRNGAEAEDTSNGGAAGAAGTGAANGAAAGGASSTDAASRNTSFITSITSRHADKVGNGKTTLAVAAIQTVEVRERFSDGISWIKLGRKPLTEKDIRCMYEEIFDQLFSDVYTSMMNAQAESNAAASSSEDDGGGMNGGGGNGNGGEGSNGNRNSASNAAMDRLRTARKRFQFGELEGIREDISELVCKRKILLVLDDVWRAEDACWFLFNQGSSMGSASAAAASEEKENNNNNNSNANGDNPNGSNKNNEPSPFQILITTRFPGLLGAGMAQEVFVRILTEHEAVKLLIASAGKKPQGGKAASIMTESKVVVKGCGNSPLAIRLAGGLLRNKNVLWTLVSTSWLALYAQSKACLSEATQLRSFSKAFGRILDLSFTAIEEPRERASLRRCFVMFAMVFHSNVTVHTRGSGNASSSASQKPGIPRDIVLGLLSVIQASEPTSNVNHRLTAEGLLETLERMNLLERTVILEQSALSGNGDNGADGDATEQSSTFQMDDGDTTVINSVAPGANGALNKRRQRVTYSSYAMHDSIAAVAEEMAQRDTPSFAPPEDVDHAFGETSTSSASQNAANLAHTPLRNVGKYLVQLAQRMDSPNVSMALSQFHELAVASLTGGWTVRTNRQTPIVPLLNDRAGFEFGVEEYLVAYFPSHLIKAKALVSAGDVLVDTTFIKRRIKAMGPIDGTRQHVNDLVELRRALSKSSSASKKGRTPDRSGAAGENSNDASTEVDSNAAAEDTSKMDISMIMRDSTRRMIDEVYAVDNNDGQTSDDDNDNINSNGNGNARANAVQAASSNASLNMAICLSTLGEGLLKCRQPRDAMLRLEEAVGMYRSLLGPYHMDVARSLGCVAKALVKLSESRVAVLKFGEAARIYEACDSTHHFDALSNSQSMAALLADLGDYTKAEARYEYVIGIRRSLHGNMNPSVARTLNDYAVVLAKHGKISDAIVQYQEARDAFEGAAASRTTFAFVEAGGEYGFIYDAALIDMNIASIKAKSADVEGAISSYDEGIQKMRQLDKCARMESSVDGRSKHIIASMGKIGSLKLKLNDKQGALKAYELVLKECGVNADLTSSTLSTSPTATKTEVAKAHIKCATIRRALMQEDGYAMRLTHHNKSLEHLKAAFKLYTQLNGLAHRDTQAVAQSLRQWQHEGAGLEEEEEERQAQQQQLQQQQAQQQQQQQSSGENSGRRSGNNGGGANSDSDDESDTTDDS